MNLNDELTEREISGIHQENFGPPFKRIASIVDRVLDAHIQAALKPIAICGFMNKFGICKIEEGHLGTHTVIFLGDD